MKEFKGTPGPWRVVTFQSNDEIHNAEGKCLADCWSYDIDGDCGSSLANANIMAAAPELLAALQLMAAIYPYSPPCHGWEAQVEAHAVAKQAISKALGK